MVFPVAKVFGTERRISRWVESNTRSFEAWFITIAANAVPVGELTPPVVPVKNVEGAESPPLAAGFKTVILAVPGVKRSAVVIDACSRALDTKVVERGLPFH